MSAFQIMLLLCLGIGTAVAEESEQRQEFIEQGQKFAEQSCSRCHDISPDGALNQSPPSFSDIAASRSLEQNRQRIMATPAGSEMPDIGLSWWASHKDVIAWYPGQNDHLIAYIVSLKQR